MNTAEKLAHANHARDRFASKAYVLASEAEDMLKVAKAALAKGRTFVVQERIDYALEVLNQLLLDAVKEKQE